MSVSGPSLLGRAAGTGATTGVEFSDRKKRPLFEKSGAKTSATLGLRQ
jgi:hypothetical protein